MNTDRVRHFVSVAHLGSVSAAARELHVSQPALSRSIKHLEEDLKTDLFYRHKNSLLLTDAGQELLPYAEELLRAESRLHRRAQELIQRENIVQVATVAPAPLWYLTSAVVSHMPGVLISSTLVDDEADAERLLINKDIDLAICCRAVPGCERVVFMEENLYLSVPARHPLAKRTSVSFSELDGETFLLYGSIGLWAQIHNKMTPHSSLLVQEDREVWRQTMRTSDMLGFASDAPILMRPDIKSDPEAAEVERVRIPIVDPEAHLTFYLCAQRDAKQDVVAKIMQLAAELETNVPEIQRRNRQE